jgi:hypothetical protein
MIIKILLLLHYYFTILIFDLSSFFNHVILPLTYYNLMICHLFNSHITRNQPHNTYITLRTTHMHKNNCRGAPIAVLQSLKHATVLELPDLVPYRPTGTTVNP